MRNLLVIGSINMDIVNTVAQFPLPGETLHSSGMAFFPGGKGANQAVAAARAGAHCMMAGAVGSDPFAETLTAALGDNGVDVRSLLRKEGTSGIAIITVNGEGENNIILSEGANGKLTEEDAAAAVSDWADVHAVLLQNEIPWPTTLSVIQSASRSGVRVLFNPAPAMEIPDEVFADIDTLIVNETEAAVVSGIQVSDAASAQAAARWIIGKGTNQVIITLGKKGSVYENAQGGRAIIPAFHVDTVDSTAAGDTFIGAYAAASADGMKTEAALTFASAAAALAVTKAGAQSSIPSRAEIEAFLENVSLSL